MVVMTICVGIPFNIAHDLINGNQDLLTTLNGKQQSFTI